MRIKLLAGMLADGAASLATAAGSTVGAEKAILRTQIKSSLKSLSAAAIAAHSAEVQTQLRTLQCYSDAAHVSVYLSMAKEVQTKSILQDLFARDKHVCIPKVPTGVCTYSSYFSFSHSMIYSISH